MVNDLRELLRESAADPPPSSSDLAVVLSTGRRRVRVRRAGLLGGTAVATAAVVVVASLFAPDGTDRGNEASGVPTPAGSVLRLTDAERAVEGRDYRTLAAYTNENLDRANGQYFDGVTDDGLILFRDGPHGIDNISRYALLDPGTGDKDWLPAAPMGQEQAWPVSLTEQQLVLMTYDYGAGGVKGRPVANVFDRSTRQWRQITWSGLRAGEAREAAVIGPDDRLYVAIPAKRGQPPEGGWPTGPDGEADDADAEGDSNQLWSVSLTDPTDVREEDAAIGDFAFTDTAMVWTDRTNGDSGLIHVRDLGTGQVRAFDPKSGERCNLLSFGVSADQIVLGQYCGTYEDGRDDRIQIVSTSGDQIVTIQGNGLDVGLASPAAAGGLVTLTSYDPEEPGTYVYDLATRSLMRVSDRQSKFAVGSSLLLPPDRVLWSTPVNGDQGATQVLAEWLG